MKLQWFGGPWDGSFEDVTPGMPTHPVAYDSQGLRCDGVDAVEIRLYSIVALDDTDVRTLKILWREIPSAEQKAS